MTYGNSSLSVPRSPRSDQIVPSRTVRSLPGPGFCHTAARPTRPPAGAVSTCPRMRRRSRSGEARKL